MISEDKITVVIPTKNRENFLKFSLTSVLNQSYKNLEIIILDNNSSDNTKKYIDSIQDNRIKYFNSNKDLSMTENWNRMFDYISTKYFARLDDDNLLHEDFILNSYKIIKENNADFVYLNNLRVKENKFDLMWKINPEIININYKKLIKLESLCLTDSNALIVNFESLKEIVPKREIFKTFLPDRYLFFRLASHIKTGKIKVLISTQIGVISYYDHQSRDIEPCFVNYKNIGRNEFLKNPKIKSNFNFLKASVFEDFIKELEDINIKNFFTKNICDKEHFITLKYLGHLYRMKVEKIIDIYPLLLNYLYIMYKITKYPLKKIEAKSSFYFFSVLSKLFISKVVKLFHRKKKYRIDIENIYNSTFKFTKLSNFSIYEKNPIDINKI